MPQSDSLVDSNTKKKFSACPLAVKWPLGTHDTRLQIHPQAEILDHPISSYSKKEDGGIQNV